MAESGGPLTERIGVKLGIDRTACVAYFLYGSNPERNKGTLTPTFWMHQLDDITKASMLNKSDFEQKVKELLASTK